MEKFSNPYEKNIKQKIEHSLTAMGLSILQEKPSYDKESFIEPKKVSPESIKSFFEQNGFIIKEPVPLVIKNGTTLFVSAGIQILEEVIHKETEFLKTPLFINQPVLRSQFLGSSGIETHTSFHNLTTIGINISIDNHMQYLKKWIDYLISQGFNKEGFTFTISESEPRWGKKRFSNIVIGVFYGGLDIGDAVYIPAMPQDTRDSFSISDIGFGLERLNHNPKIVNTPERDCLKTLALLASSGVRPGNRKHAYRFRLFSKEFVALCKLDFQKMRTELDTLGVLMDLWSESILNQIDEKELLIKRIVIECERNFNREILNFLENEFSYKREIDINQETKDFLSQLRKIGDKPAGFWNDLETKINFK